MAYRTRRSASAESNETVDYHQLEQERNRNDQKLKARFEHIFRKYEHDFNGVGDEIEIESGDIVVDNGHLQYMQHEVDPGKSASSRFVRTFQEKLGYEDESNSSEEEEEESDEESDLESETDDSGDDGEQEPEPSRRREGQFESFGHLARPAPRLAHLLVDSATTKQSLDSLADEESMDGSLEESIAEGDGHANPQIRTGAMHEHIGIQQSRGKRVDHVKDNPTSIEALGASIANQLAQLMAGPAKKTARKSKKKVVKSSRQSVWDYPEISRNIRRKRRRNLSPVAQQVPQPVSPPGGSPSNSSLWAPTGAIGRGRKRIRHETVDDEGRTTPFDASNSTRLLLSSGSHSARTDARRCWNCSITGSSHWHRGPHGQDLCISCGKYYECNGRMKPFDSATPSADDRDSTERKEEEQGIEELVASSPELPQEIRAVIEQPQAEINAFQIEPRGWKENDIAREAVQPQTMAEQFQPASFMNVSSTNDTASTVHQWRDTEPTPATEFQPHVNGYMANTSRPLTDVPPLERYSNGFSVEEDALLIRLKEKELLDWTVISRSFPDRSMYALQNRYSAELQGKECQGRNLLATSERLQSHANTTLSTPTLQRRMWTEEQDETLIRLRERGELEWADIAMLLPDFSSADVQRRYRLLMKSRSDGLAGPWTSATPRFTPERMVFSPERLRIPFSAEEDALIVRLREVSRLSWAETKERLPLRNLSAVQSRYSRWLAPDKRRILHTAKSDTIQGTIEERLLAVDPALAGGKHFTPEEDELIRLLRDDERLEWPDIAQRLINRTASSVKHRYQYKSQVVDVPRETTPSGSCVSGILRPWSHKTEPVDDDSLLGCPQPDTLCSPATRSHTPISSNAQMKLQAGKSITIGQETNLHPVTRSQTPNSNHLQAQMRAESDFPPEIARSTTTNSVDTDTLPRGAKKRSSDRVRFVFYDPVGTMTNNIESALPEQRSLQRKRYSFPADAPSMQVRNGTPLLRKALRNSLRRRSDGTIGPARSDDRAASTASAFRPLSIDAHDSDDESSQTFYVGVDDIVNVKPHRPAPDAVATENDSEVISPASPDRSTRSSRRPERIAVCTPAITYGTAHQDASQVSDESPFSAQRGRQSKECTTTHHQVSTWSTAAVRTAAQSATEPHGRRTRSMAVRDHMKEVDGALEASHIGVSRPQQVHDYSTPPELTYRQLITSTLESDLSRPFKCREIYRWIEDHFDYYHNNKSSWKARIRAELNSAACFRRIRLEAGGTGWQLASQLKEKSGTENDLSYVHRNNYHDDDATTTDLSTAITAISVAPNQRRLTGAQITKEPARRATADDFEDAAADAASHQEPTDAPLGAICSRSGNAEIPDSEDEKDIIMVTDDDEITLPSSPPSAVVKTRRNLSGGAQATSSAPAAAQRTVIRHPHSSIQSAHSKAATASTLSSSPAHVELLKLKAPRSTCEVAKTSKNTPSLASRAKPQGDRANVETPISRLAYSALKGAQSQSISKRVVETPSRELGPDDDELA